MERYGLRHCYEVGDLVVLRDHTIRLHGKQGHRIFKVIHKPTFMYCMVEDINGYDTKPSLVIMRLATEKDILRGLSIEKLQIQKAANMFTKGTLTHYQQETITKINALLRKYRLPNILTDL
jgi:hypothetical protein